MGRKRSNLTKPYRIHSTALKLYEHDGIAYPYWKIHYLIKKQYGPANRCDGKDCRGNSTRYEWSNISHEYKLDISDWQQLCKSCHMRFDQTEKSLQALRDRNARPGINMRHKSKGPVLKLLKDGTIIASYVTAREAALSNNMNPSRISHVLTNRGKTAGGFKWRYDDTKKTS
jgi:hypothetical protein